MTAPKDIVEAGNKNQNKKGELYAQS